MIQYRFTSVFAAIAFLVSCKPRNYGEGGTQSSGACEDKNLDGCSDEQIVQRASQLRADLKSMNSTIEPVYLSFARDYDSKTGSVLALDGERQPQDDYPRKENQKEELQAEKQRMENKLKAFQESLKDLEDSKKNLKKKISELIPELNETTEKLGLAMQEQFARGKIGWRELHAEASTLPDYVSTRAYAAGYHGQLVAKEYSKNGISQPERLKSLKDCELIIKPGFIEERSPTKRMWLYVTTSIINEVKLPSNNLGALVQSRFYEKGETFQDGYKWEKKVGDTSRSFKVEKTTFQFDETYNGTVSTSLSTDLTFSTDQTSPVKFKSTELSLQEKNPDANYSFSFSCEELKPVEIKATTWWKYVGK